MIRACLSNFGASVFGCFGRWHGGSARCLPPRSHRARFKPRVGRVQPSAAAEGMPEAAATLPARSASDSHRPRPISGRRCLAVWRRLPEVRASSTNLPERSSDQVGGATKDAETCAGRRQSTVASGASRPPGRRSFVGAEPGLREGARAKRFAMPQGTRPGPARASRQARPSAVGEAFCPRASAEARKLHLQRAASPRRAKAR